MTRQNLEQQAYEHILHLITTKILHDGDFINQSYIATELNMSRTPIRNAIARLAGEGKIRSLPRHGAFVRQH